MDTLTQAVVQGVVLTALYTIVGAFLLLAMWWLVDLRTPGSLSEKVFHEGNNAAAIMAGAFLIAFAIIINGALS